MSIDCNSVPFFDWNIVIACTGLIVAFVSIWALFIENRKWRLSLNIDLLFRLNDKYDIEEMKGFRRNAAKLLLHYQDNKKDKECCDALDEVLDFFEMVGNLVQRGAIDKEMIWHNFSNSILAYWTFAKKTGYIKEIMEKDSSIWEDVPFLYNAINKIGKVPLENELTEFLEGEIRL